MAVPDNWPEQLREHVSRLMEASRLGFPDSAYMGDEPFPGFVLTERADSWDALAGETKRELFHRRFRLLCWLEDLHRQLSVILGCRVDVIEEPVRKAGLQAEIDRDRDLVF